MRFPQQFIPVCRRGKYVRRKDWVACRFHDHGDPSVALTAEARSWWRLADKTGRQIFRHASTVDAMAKGLSQGAPPAKARGAESKGKDASAHKKTVRVVEPNEVLESETNGANEDLDDEEAMHEGEDEAGISEKGIQRIMRALGDDGLSDFDLAALQSLYGEQGVEDEDDEDVDEEVENEEADESEDNETDENEEEVDEVDEAGDEDEGEEEGDEDEGEKDIVDKEEEDEDEEPDGKAASAPQDSFRSRWPLAFFAVAWFLSLKMSTKTKMKMRMRTKKSRRKFPWKRCPRRRTYLKTCWLQSIIACVLTAVMHYNASMTTSVLTARVSRDRCRGSRP